MRALFGSLTTRGRSFMAAGGAAMVCGLAIPETDLVRVVGEPQVLAVGVHAEPPALHLGHVPHQAK